MTVEVTLWGRRIAAVSQEPGETYATFQYFPEFIPSEIQVAPLMMPLRQEPYAFPALPYNTFKGLPGLLADSLPDKFGNALINEWLARQGRTPDSFSVLERLCYVGSRGMGALEFRPLTGPRFTRTESLQVDQLVKLANSILDRRNDERLTLPEEPGEAELVDILRVGTSAGGARAKAIIAWNPTSGEVRSGQVPTDPEFEYWLLKFDGVQGNRDKELADPLGFGAIEYAYSQMAKAAGIQMSECRLLEENGRRHFMTKRFDRQNGGAKLHMQSLGGIAHYDFNLARGHSYEQAVTVLRKLGLGPDDILEQFRRAVFNIVARNQDDHVKNIAFLMDKAGTWTLSPAFDITYSFNPSGAWTSSHQMTLNGKVDQFTRADLLAFAKFARIPKKLAETTIEQVEEAVARWPRFAAEANIPDSTTAQISAAHRAVA